MKKLSFILTKLILIVSFILLASFVVTTFFSKTYLALSGNNVDIYFFKQNFGTIILFVLGILFSPFLLKISKTLTKKGLFWSLASLYLLFGCYLIFNVTDLLRADAAAVYSIAHQFNQGNYQEMTTVGGYLYFHPHQLGLVSFERFYAFFSNSPRLVFIGNLLMVIGINWLQLKVSELLFPNKDDFHTFTILLSYAFLPLLFFILFAYGSIPGLFFSLLGYYFILLWDKGGRIRVLWLPLAGSSFALASLIRNNYQIFSLAILVCLFLKFLRTKGIRYVLASLILLITSFLFGFVQNLYYQQITHQPIPVGVPKSAYVSMGIRHEPAYRVGGWYTGYNTAIYAQNEFDNKRTDQGAKVDIQNRLQEFAKTPSMALKFFAGKIRSTWLEPTYQSVWSGPLNTHNDKVDGILLKSIYREKIGYRMLTIWDAVVMLLIFGFSLIAILTIWKSSLLADEFRLLPFIYFIGGFTFHLFWETKSQYVFPYVYCLIPLAAYGLFIYKETLRNHLARKEKATTAS